MPSLVEPLDVVVAPQQAVSWFQFSPQQVHEVTRKVAPPVVDLAHDDVSGTFGGKTGEMLESFLTNVLLCFFEFLFPGGAHRA